MKKICSITLFFKCGICGWCLECIFTGLKSLLFQKERKMICTTSIWMFPIYGLACLLKPLIHLLGGKSLITRGLIYTLSIFFGEYVSGSLLKRKGMCPWDYSNSKYNINGLIRLDYAPCWCITGFIFEKILSKME